MATKKPSKKQSEEQFEKQSVDRWGVPRFLGEKIGDEYRVDYYDPFEQMLTEMKGASVGAEFPSVDDVVLVHDTLKMARSIAISIYGPKWPDFVLPIYSLLKSAK